MPFFCFSDHCYGVSFKVKTTLVFLGGLVPGPIPGLQGCTWLSQRVREPFTGNKIATHDEHAELWQDFW